MIKGGRRLIVEADGGSRGNPGPAGYGAVVRDADSGEVLAELAAALGTTTNNVAEYQGLIAGLRAAAELAPAEVEVRLDSKLVVEQLSGRWKVKQPHLQPLAAEAAALVRALPRVRLGWVPRSRNAHADRLANEAMDAAARGEPWQQTSHGDSSLRTPTSSGWSGERPEPTRMLLLRHGETAYSVDRRFSGRREVPLTDRGRAQAEAAAKRIAGLDGVAAVITSPLGRARETAAAVAEITGLRPVVDGDLTEADYGEWDGLTFREVRERWPSHMDSWLASTEVAPPGGESFAVACDRVRRTRDRTVAAHPGQTVVLVSHVTPIKLLLQMGLDAGPHMLFRLHLDLASLSIVDWHSDGTATVRLVNDTSHLG